MRYLVTGGCGFIGAHLATMLADAGHTLTILDDLSSGQKEKAPVPAMLVVGDIRNARLVKRLMAESDGCFHLAAIASVQLCNEQWVESHSVNCTGALTIFNAAAAAGKPVVFASSAAVYGDSDVLPLTEDATTNPLSAYGADKLACELHARAATQTHNMRSIAIRPFNVYGPGQMPDSPYSGVISLFAQHILSSEAITIYGDGEQARDFIYVEDVCRHFTAAMRWLENTKKPVHETVNACTGHATTVLDLATALEKAAGHTVARRHMDARHGDIRLSEGNPSKAEKLFSVRAETPLKEGLARTLASLKDR